MNTRRLLLRTTLAAAALLAGCAVEPWVKPYERERLADPIMKFSRDAIADKHREHIYDVREGARGATGIQEAAVAATERWAQRVGVLGGLLGGVLTSGEARAVDLPEDRADAMVHVYNGGGVRATGPALLLRKKVAQQLSVSGSYYVDKVSNASIDVVTTASPYKETRNEVTLGADYVVRDAQVSVSASRSKEPDYVASAANLDVTQEVFGGLTSVSLGFTRGIDDVGKKNTPTFNDTARHWRWRAGVTQILTPRWLASVNAEVLSDDGFLGSPYRSAREFGSFVPERNPRTRTARAVKFRSINDLGPRASLRAEYRYYTDTWDIKAHTVELGMNRYVGDAWLAEGFVRYHSQGKALFYADDGPGNTAYASRNRQLSSFTNLGFGAKAAYDLHKSPGLYELKGHLAYELLNFRFKDFTDLRSGAPYRYRANVFQLFVSATF